LLCAISVHCKIEKAKSKLKKVKLGPITAVQPISPIVPPMGPFVLHCCEILSTIPGAYRQIWLPAIKMAMTFTPRFISRDFKVKLANIQRENAKFL
jgi:hypothetical protein